jgi:hypothetical protein
MRRGAVLNPSIGKHKVTPKARRSDTLCKAKVESPVSYIQTERLFDTDSYHVA